MATFESELPDGFAPTYHASRNERNHLAQLEPQPKPTLELPHPLGDPTCTSP